MQFKREKYLNQLIERMHNGEIKVITGIRLYQEPDTDAGSWK